MTTVTIYKSDSDSYKGFTCFGHAGYAKSGEDIVCAAISVLTTNTINSMECLAHEKFEVKVNEETGFLDCRFDHKMNEQSKLLIESMILGLESIAEQYGKKYIKLKFEEV